MSLYILIFSLAYDTMVVVLMLSAIAVISVVTVHVIFVVVIVELKLIHAPVRPCSNLERCPAVIGTDRYLHILY